MGRSNLAKLQRQFNISRWAIAHPWLTVGTWIAIALAGLLSFSSLRYALFPDITFPVTVITASAPYDTALQIEALLTDPIEQQLISLDRLENLHSFVYPRQTVISAEFVLGTDLDEAKQTVETLLEDTYLPDEADVQVIPFNLNESSAISYALHSKTNSLVELSATVRQEIVPALESIPGVLRVELLGGQLPDGTPNVLPTQAATTPTLVRFNGDDALAIQVIKQGRANTLDIVERVQKQIAILQQRLPDVSINLAASQADFIREATQSTIDSLGLAVILAVAAIIVFLRNWRATAIAALTIPLSLMGAFVAMAAFGFNLETITLLALALAIGIVVDDAIVEVENISRYLEKGYSPAKAAIAATAEIGLTVSATTLTIVAVFLPIALMGGILGQFFKPFGLVVSTAVLTSLLAARTLVPVLAVWWLGPSRKEPRQTPALLSRRFGLWEQILRQYRCLLQWSLNHRGGVLSLAVASLAVGLALLPFVPQGFIPALDRGEFNVAYSINGLRLSNELAADGTEGIGSDRLPEFEDLPEDIAQYLTENGLVEQYLASLEASKSGDPVLLPVPPELLLRESQKVASELEATVVPFPDVDSVLTLVGYRGEINGGKLRVKLGGDRRLHTAAIQDRLRQTLPQLPNVEVGVEDIQFVETGDEKPLQLALFGDDLEKLYATAAAIRQKMAQQPEFADIAITGMGSNRSTISEIEHRDAKRAAFVRANLRPGRALGNATETALAIAKPLLPEGVTLDLTGDSAAIATVLGSFSRTLALSIACMFLVLLILFRRWTDPMVVLLSLPLAVVGAAIGLLVARSDFGIISVIGAIFLLGLLDKNAILIVDYTNQLRQRGLSRTEALLTAGPVRLRPILMTTASTVLGMLPIALGLGAGAELRSPMAVAIIGGLLTSTALSLIVVPVLYAVLDDWTRVGRKQDARG
ncbi:efflux RND transporter permease subunit [Synechococcus sp. PCC 7336]|uniref:efflux RND transporter permease subunit n=1 Tax=Synechococcus sp. PCC 7336 TaxID=195250 RepID=UPI00056DA1E2|nr:efflux RND transporter permease subunit [Synechococcus sp. PCC 7336]